MQPTPQPAHLSALHHSETVGDLATLDQAARLTIRLLERINLASLRFSERQRLARILLRLERVAGEVHDLMPLAR